MTAHEHGRHSALLEALHHVAHHLPGQAPLSEFVHHNTLHGDQHLGFVSAVDAAMKRTGARGYPAPEQCGDWYRAGRVTDADLASAIEECTALAPQQPVIPGHPLRRAEVIRAALVMNAGPIDATRLRWELMVHRSHANLPAGLPAAARAALLSKGDEAGVVGGVWDRIRELLGLTDVDPHPEHLVDLQPGLASALRQGVTEGAESGVRAAMWDHARRRVARWRSATGMTSTHRELLLALTGVDIELAIRPYIVRWMSAFLDEGVAPWPLADRERGLWRTWRELAPGEAWDRWGLPDAVALIQATPEDPADALSEGLLALGVDPEGPAVQAYCEALALRLPGFFGMTAWREGRADWPAQQIHPVRLLDALALRVTVERIHAGRVCQDSLGAPARLDALFDALEARPVEVMVREALHAGRMPGHLAWRARAAEAGTWDAPDPFGDVALAWWTWNHTRDGNMPGRPTLARTAWPVFRVCIALGLGPDDVVALGAEGLHAVHTIVESLDEGQRGLVWLMALEKHYRDEVLAGLAANRGRGRWRERTARPRFQIAFCIDDREEAIRRHIEERAPEVETFGVAGFFGVPMRWRGLDDAGEVSLCPPALTAVHQVWEAPRPEARAAHELRARGQGWLAGVQRAMQRLRTGLVEQTLATAAAGPLWAVPTLTRAAAPVLWERAMEQVQDRVAPPVLTLLERTRTSPPPASGERAGFTLDEQADRVMGTLRNVGLTQGFSRLVVWMGHGSHSRNNPHLAAYDCGACGGRHGGPNARAFAAMANDPEVRRRLRDRGVHIPDDTWFLGAEHDTADDRILWSDLVDLPSGFTQDFEELQALLRHACEMSAHERCRKFESAPTNPTPARALRHVIGRAFDPFQARPELGHATNATAVVGRRSLTRGLFLDRRAFLVSYDPTIDPDTRICEGILAAVGPVGAGISLEYYFSTVDNDRFGCGTKVTHNIFGMIGVMEGTRGDLRTGLPKQMIEIHEPMRLLLVVEQTPEVLLAIVGRQPGVAELVAGAWIQVVSIDPVDGHAERFVPGVGFVRWEPPAAQVPSVKASPEWYTGKLDFLAPALVGGAHV